MARRTSLALMALALLAGTRAAAQTVPAMPDDVKPIRTSGLGLTVSDLEKSKTFYTEVLGMKVDARVPAQGPAQEYLLGFTGNSQVDTLVVIRQGAVQPAAASFGRIVIVVPSGRKMAERVKAAGFPVANIVDGANVITDPDGYKIELYQRPASRSP